MDKVIFSGNTRRNKRERKGVHFVTTYQLSLNQNLYILYMNEEGKSIFTPAPMISFRSTRNLSSYLVRPKLYPSKRTVDSVQCKEKQCQTCRNVKETETFTSTTTVKTFTINHSLTYNDKYLVYRPGCEWRAIVRAHAHTRHILFSCSIIARLNFV